MGGVFLGESNLKKLFVTVCNGKYGNVIAIIHNQRYLSLIDGSKLHLKQFMVI